MYLKYNFNKLILKFIINEFLHGYQIKPLFRALWERKDGAQGEFEL